MSEPGSYTMKVILVDLKIRKRIDSKASPHMGDAQKTRYCQQAQYINNFVVDFVYYPHRKRV